MLRHETPPTPVEQLCEYVVDRANRGDDVAAILAGALEVFGEDPEEYAGRHRVEVDAAGDAPAFDFFQVEP